MRDTEIIRYADCDYKDPIAIVGFPGVGLAGSILAGFVIRELNMDVIAGITSRDFPPYTLIRGGNPYPPLRIYGHKSAGSHNDLVIATSEMSLKPEQFYDVCTALMDLFRELKIKNIIALEGIPQFDDNNTIFACGTTPSSKEKIKMLGLTELEEGMVRGLTGIMLYEGFHNRTDVLAVLCPANPTLPDPAAAAKMLEPLSKMIPEFDIDTGPLYQEAKDLENKIKEQQHFVEKMETANNGNIYG